MGHLEGPACVYVYACTPIPPWRRVATSSAPAVGASSACASDSQSSRDPAASLVAEVKEAIATIEKSHAVERTQRKQKDTEKEKKKKKKEKKVRDDVKRVKEKTAVTSPTRTGTDKDRDKDMDKVTKIDSRALPGAAAPPASSGQFSSSGSASGSASALCDPRIVPPGSVPGPGIVHCKLLPITVKTNDPRIVPPGSAPWAGPSPPFSGTATTLGVKKKPIEASRSPPSPHASSLNDDSEEEFRAISVAEAQCDKYWGARVSHNGCAGRVESLEKSTSRDLVLYLVRYDDGDIEHFSRRQVKTRLADDTVSC